jgi:exodeoxyribonuclease VII large subunit
MSPFPKNSRDNFYSLSSISSGISDAVWEQFGERSYWIVAEISELNVRKGHCYLSLVEKLPGSASPVCELKGIIWANKFERVSSAFAAETGMSLAAGTRILFQAIVRYDVKWGLSLVIEDVEPKYTVGLIQVERDRAVAKLKADHEYGLNRALAFPLVPARLAVISARDSKGYEDFINKLTRNPEGYRYEVTLFPSLLQGEGAPGQITDRLLEIFKTIASFDVVVIVRGGGGSIDLNCFNDYKLARAVARFPIPVITGIGHTTNISVVDEVAHADCITPTDAADFIVQRTAMFESRLDEIIGAIVDNYEESAGAARDYLSEAAGHLAALGKNRLQSSNESLSVLLTMLTRSGNAALRDGEASLRLIIRDISSKASEQVRSEQVFINRDLAGRLVRMPALVMDTSSLKIDKLESSVRHLDPASILKRGFSITRKNGKAITDAGQLESGDQIITQFYEGTIQSEVTKKQ